MNRVIGAAAILAAAVSSVLGTQEAAASGFAIRENSAEALGTAFAGNASSADFLSTIFNNPAGMTHFTGDRAQADASLILPSLRFEGTATQQCAITCPTPTPVSGEGSGNAGQAAFVPAGYILHSFSPDLKIGFALTVPFGLETKYPDDWVGRFFGIKSELKTIDLNPNVAYRINPWLSVGAGFSAQYMSADLTNALDFSNPRHIPFPDGLARVHGSDWGFGGNAGVLLEPLDGTAIGVTYRSRVDHKISGSLDVTTPLGTSSRSATAAVTTPDSVDLSVTQKITDKLHIAADLQWTNWSVFQNLTVRTSSGVASSTPEHFRNTWFASVGGTYNWDDHWTFRAGVAFDQTPVTDAFRTVRLPDSNRYWLAFGAGYKFSDGFSVDVGVSHIFMPDGSLNSSVNSTTVGFFGTVDKIKGKYSNMIDLISLQTRFRF
jgi:long-chain fatty acid transport protein